jgi:DNA-binding transcriptional ArsR family regulator
LRWRRPAREEIPMEKRSVLSAMAALAQETRLDIFRLLVQAGPEGRSAGAIAESLGVAPATLSFHLAQLNHAGLVAQRRESRSLIYTAEYDRMNDLVAFLTENCCGRPMNAGACGPACVPTPAAANGKDQGPGAAAVPTRSRRGR